MRVGVLLSKQDIIFIEVFLIFIGAIWLSSPQSPTIKRCNLPHNSELMAMDQTLLDQVRLNRAVIKNC
jgi:hypothetical protein